MLVGAQRLGNSELKAELKNQVNHYDVIFLVNNLKVFLPCK